MKKFMILILILSMALCLFACGSAKPDTTEGTKGNEATQNAATKAPEVTDPSQPEEQFRFVYKGTEITLHAAAEPIVAALGEPMKYSESTSCAFDGLDKSYYYGSFYLDTYPDGDKDYVYGWWFADDSVTTEEGIFIGASQAQVETAYGTDAYNGSNAFIVDRGDGRLTVILEEGVVTSIQYAILMNP